MIRFKTKRNIGMSNEYKKFNGSPGSKKIAPGANVRKIAPIVKAISPVNGRKKFDLVFFIRLLVNKDL